MTNSKCVLRSVTLTAIDETGAAHTTHIFTANADDALDLLAEWIKRGLDRHDRWNHPVVAAFIYVPGEAGGILARYRIDGLKAVKEDA